MKKVKRKKIIKTSRTKVGNPGFDIENTELDMTREEKLRATALLLASRYYVETICKDGALYTAMIMKGEQLKPATSNAIVGIACQFHDYLETGKVKFLRRADGNDVVLIDPSKPEKKEVVGSETEGDDHKPEQSSAV